jgi:hypothetical protein
VRAHGLQVGGVAAIGFERESVFKARPHPDLLLQEKEQPEDVAGFAERLSDGFCHWQGLTAEAFPINPWEHPTSNIQGNDGKDQISRFNIQRNAHVQSPNGSSKRQDWI